MIKELWEGIRDGFIGGIKMATPVLVIVAVGVAMLLFMLVAFWFSTKALA